MTYKICDDCGCRIYNLGCVNCNELDYIQEQVWLDETREKETEPQPTNSKREI